MLIISCYNPAMLDSPQSLVEILQLATAITFLLGLIFSLLAYISFRHSRQDTYWRQRRKAGQQGLQYILLGLIVLGISGALCLITVTIAFVENERQEDALAIPSPSASPTQANLIPTLPDTQTLPAIPLTPPLETPTPSPEITPEFVVAAPTPNPTSAPPIDAKLEIRAIDDVISETWQPIQPETVFPIGTKRVYVFFSYQDMPRGSTWGQVLLRDGTVVQQQIQQWGITGPQGESFFFFGDNTGFPSGSYEVRLTFGAEGIVLASAHFTIAAE